MRRLVIGLTLLLACGLAMPAAAQDDDWEDDGWEEEAGDEGDDWDDDEDWDDDDWDDDEDYADDEGVGYFDVVSDKFLMGLTSTLTWPADPVIGAASPRKEFDELPGSVVVKYPVGFFQGLLLGVYRLAMGPLDMLFAPITPMVMLSPEPRYNLFDIEHDTY